MHRKSQRIEPGGQQSSGTIRVCRAARAQAETLAQGLNGNRWRSCAWSRLLAQYAAFWQARCCVTNAYQHQGLMPTCDPQAVTMHWGHSVLQESFFTSPWAAIESAQDLAIEVGNWGPLRCENFVLPPISKKIKGTVHFADEVELLQGKDHSGKFQLQTTIINDCGQDLPPLCGPDDQHACSDGTGHQVSASSSSRGTLYDRNFLDRKLPQELPGYVHHLQHLWRDNLLRLPQGQRYRVRTWYLHHLHQRVWTVPREIHLPTNPEDWHDALLLAWRDQLHNDEVLNIAVTFPEIRALRETFPAHADLILIQGDPAQAGGITTVFPPTVDDQGSYTWATSLPRHVSGIDILRAANAEVILQSHACDLFHGGINIPITTAPSHWMQNGHAFVAIFQDLSGAQDVRGNDLSERPTASTSTKAATENATAQHLPSPVAGEDLGEISEESSPLATSSFDENEFKGLHVFGLMQPVHHCFVRWRSYINILLDVLREVGLHRDLAIGFHHVQVPLIDQHVEEEAIILQRVGDVPAGSPDQLIVVDIVFEEQHDRAVTPQRQVYRFPRFVGRSATLERLHMGTTCNRDSPDTSCLLFLNRIFWDQDDEAPREFTHGAYLRVIVLPPKDGTRAPTVVRQCDSTGPPSKKPRTADKGSPVEKITPTGSSLLQVSIAAHFALDQGPRTHSANFPSLAATNAHTATQATQIGRSN